ncbi:MAG: hypothetical protein BZY87_02305 [SAR202 cluster bacterium Io17-Chloro-G6]|nr:MAG: hypothetical protein BZY87_02305 [SAR202 cluster bacterium Io17-Chloro-G6]
MANEFFRHYGPDAAVAISPRGQSIMEVFFNGERIYDKKGEGNIFPDLKRVREMRQVIDAKLGALEPAPADD